MKSFYCHYPNLSSGVSNSLKHTGESSDSNPSLGSKSEFRDDPETKITIIRQPQKFYRFRYQSEGCNDILSGKKGTKGDKSFPAVEITPPLVKHALVLATCVAKKEPHRVLPLQLHGKYCKNGIYFKKIRPGSATLKLKDIRIVRVQRKDYKPCMDFKAAFAKFDPFNHGYWRESDSPAALDADAVRIAIQMFLKDEASDKYRIRVAPVLTDIIYGRRSSQPTLAIEQLSQVCAYADGRLLCDRSKLVVMYRQRGRFPPESVIRVRFFEMDGKKTLWKIYAKIIDRAGTSIWCDPPKYFDQEIKESKQIFLQLVAMGKGIVSKPVPFMIVPKNDEMHKKLLNAVNQCVAKDSNVSINSRPGSQQQKRIKHLLSTDPEALTKELKKFRPNIGEPSTLPILTSTDHEEVNIFPPAYQKIVPKSSIPISPQPGASERRQKILSKSVPTDPIEELSEFLKFPGRHNPSPSEDNNTAAFVHSQKTVPKASGTVMFPQPGSSTTCQKNLAVPVQILSVLDHNILPNASSAGSLRIQDFQGNFWTSASEMMKPSIKDIPGESVVNLDDTQKNMVQNKYQKPRDKENVKPHHGDSPGPSRLEESQVSRSKTLTFERKVINTLGNSVFPNGACTDKPTFPEITRLLQENPNLKLYDSPGLKPSRLEEFQISQSKAASYDKNINNIYEKSVLPDQACKLTSPEIMRLLQDNPKLKLYDSPGLGPSMLEESEGILSKTASFEELMINIDENSELPDLAIELTSPEIARLLQDDPNLDYHYDSPALGPFRLKDFHISQPKIVPSEKKMIKRLNTLKSLKTLTELIQEFDPNY